MTESALAPADLDLLVEVSEHALRIALEEHRHWAPDVAQFPDALNAPGAAFVTLRRDGRLIGCVGRMDAVDPLVRVVADRTLAAAFSDPRTSGVRARDWDALDLEVSVLSELAPLAVDSHAGLVAHVASHADQGLLVEAGSHRATFLPSVHDQLPDASEFVAALWEKAGLRDGVWPSGIDVKTYTVTKGVGAPPRAPLHSVLWATRARSWSN